MEMLHPEQCDAILASGQHVIGYDIADCVVCDEESWFHVAADTCLECGSWIPLG
jgi:hypothetical protein